jgi:DNA-binding SARP family transcriptional activator
MKFQMLGPFEAYLANGEKIDFSHRKAQALLAYLAVERSRAQPREHLATLLWGRTGEERARHNLRQALSKLRTLCPELVDTQGSAIKLTATACQSDVSEFEDLAGSNDPAELRRALALYRGELLEGYSAREPAYQDWLELARARLHKRACDVAIKLATGLRDESRTDGIACADGTTYRSIAAIPGMRSGARARTGYRARGGN